MKYTLLILTAALFMIGCDWLGNNSVSNCDKCVGCAAGCCLSETCENAECEGCDCQDCQIRILE